MNAFFNFAHADLEQQVSHLAISTVLIGGLVLIVFTIIAALLKNRNKALRLPFFLIMAGSLVIPTIVLFGSTIYLNTHAESKGPVHWHTDIEFWACGTEMNLRDPIGRLSNKIGSPTFHEHNDKRLHLEGVVVDRQEDASLKKFMGLTGGSISKDKLVLPLNKDENKWFADQVDLVDGDAINTENRSLTTGNGAWISQTNKGALVTYINGQKCGDDSAAPAQLQTFVYSFNKKNDTYIQKKLNDPSSYVMRDEATVPPGDCVIVEYDVPKDLTKNLCQQYGVRDKKRCEQFGVKPYNPKLCNIEQVPPLGGAL